MKIDCRDLECPEPVIRTKKALDSLGEEGILEVVVNNQAAKENILRFAASQECQAQYAEDTSDIFISITKGFRCELENANASGKIFFIKSDGIGDGELGKKLMLGFLSTLSELENKPKKIFLVNSAVKLACENKEAIEALKNLHGVEIYSCGVCLEHFGLDVKVGKVGNAYDVAFNLLENHEVVSI